MSKLSADPEPVSKRLSRESVAHMLVREFVRQGVEYLFLNPGTDTAPFQEALLDLRETGEQTPEVVLCTHELVALAAAHAYFAATGRVQVVMVHVDVGTQNLGAMVHNAARSGAGVVIVAGRTPSTADGEHPGGRDAPVHWKQDVPDQAGIVRSYMKLDVDVADAMTAQRTVLRAFQIAGSAPTGPVYVTVRREVLLDVVPPGLAPRSPARFAPAAPPAAAPMLIARAAAALRVAVRPAVVTARAGGDHAAVPALVALADAIGARVIDQRERMNFPSDHPGYVAADADIKAVLKEADVIVVLDSQVPWVPATGQPHKDATIISIGLDPVQASMPGWAFPVDISIFADPAMALGQLVEALRDSALDDPPDRWPARVSGPQGLETPPGPVAESPWIAPAADERLDTRSVADALSEALAPQDIVIEEATTNARVLRARLSRTVPGTYFRSGGGGLGWGLPAVLGMKLACPDRRVAAVVGDGAFIFGAPTSALWALHSTRVGALVVVLRNGGYAASRAPVYGLFPNGTSARRREVVGTLFQDGPDLAAIARACGCTGRDVRVVAQLRPALSGALREADRGEVAVIVAHIASAWILGKQHACLSDVSKRFNVSLTVMPTKLIARRAEPGASLPDRGGGAVMAGLTLEEHLAVPYVLLAYAVPSPDGWKRRAHYPEIGTWADADTLTEAIDELERRRIDYIVRKLAASEDIPVPRPALNCLLRELKPEQVRVIRARVEAARTAPAL